MDLDIALKEKDLLLDHIKRLNAEIKRLNDVIIDCHFEIYNKDKKIDELTRYQSLPFFFCQTNDNRS